jgi:hypothetical protein
MQHWTIATAEAWETLTQKPYGQFFEVLQDAANRKVNDLVTLLACEALNQANNVQGFDMEAEIAHLKTQSVKTLSEQIIALYSAAEKKNLEG